MYISLKGEKSTLMGAAKFVGGPRCEICGRGDCQRCLAQARGDKSAKGTRHQRRCYEAVTKVVNKLRDRPELLERFDYRPPPQTVTANSWRARAGAPCDLESF